MTADEPYANRLRAAIEQAHHETFIGRALIRRLEGAGESPNDSEEPWALYQAAMQLKDVVQRLHRIANDEHAEAAT